MEKLILPTKIHKIKTFYEKNSFIENPSFILDKLREKRGFNTLDSKILIGLILARLIGIDNEKFGIKNSDVMLQVGEFPAYYISNKGEWQRDKRFPIITEELMNKIFENVVPEINKKNIIQNIAKEDRNDIDEDFAISFEVNTNFDYNEAKNDNTEYLEKPQYATSTQSDISKMLGRFRVNLASSKGKKFFVFRKLEAEIPDFYKLGLNEKFLDFNEYKEGLVLVTGPTGSGKSTTLAAMIQQINKHKSKHIITIEDPIEYVYKNDKSFFNQREVPFDTLSFSSGLKSALREKPDIIVIGELRDIETIRLAIEAAETGHLVFGTLHTFNAAKTIDRIINSFPSEEQNQIAMTLSSSILGIISQTLIKKKGGGITALNELIRATDGIRQAISDRKTDKVIQAASNSPKECILMVEHAYRLVVDEIVESKEVLSVLYKKDRPTYELLVGKLKSSNNYSADSDPYSDRSLRKKETYTSNEEIEESEVKQEKKQAKIKVSL